MAKKQKSKRTQIKDRPVEAQELTTAETAKIKGGVKAGYDLKQNKITDSPAATNTTPPSTTPTTPNSVAGGGWDVKKIGGV